MSLEKESIGDVTASLFSRSAVRESLSVCRMFLNVALYCALVSIRAASFCSATFESAQEQSLLTFAISTVFPY